MDSCGKSCIEPLAHSKGEQSTNFEYGNFNL